MKDDTRQLILEAGGQEFLDKGFAEASLRHIARQAGVTTGAIYGHYADKAALFRALVEPAASAFHTQFITVQQTFSALPAQEQVQAMNVYTSSALLDMLDYVYDHFDAFHLIICCAAGTEYEHYIDTLVDIEVESTRTFLGVMATQGITPEPLTEDLMHIMASAYFSAVFETVAHRMDREAAKAYVKQITRFFQAGWQALLHVPGE